MTEQPDYYTLLGIPRDATAEEIRKSYFDSARRLHPDRNVAPGETELFLGIQEAYETLSNPKKRAKYDQTLPPVKFPEFSLVQRLIYSRPSLSRMDEPQLVYVNLELSQPAGLQPAPTPPMNLCLVLDRSTSMQGKNIEVVKETAIQIMRKMKPQDIFSVVAFSDRAEIIIPATRSAEFRKLEARIQTLLPSGGTEIFTGLDLGYSEILRNLEYARVRHIILLTDGRTYGDEDKCLELAHHAAEKGIGISGLGIGSEWNDSFLDALASSTGGSSMYISQAQDIQKALLDKFISLGNIYADDTRLEFAIPQGVELKYAFRLQPELGVLSAESPMILGPVLHEASLKVLLEFVVQPELVQQRTATLLDGKVITTLADGINNAIPIPIRIARPVSEEPEVELPPTEIMDSLSRLKLYRLQEQARLELTAGEFDLASEHLHRLATHLLAQGERTLARTALMEAEHILQEKSFSQEGRKEIKYGTRALVTSGRRLDD